MCRRGEIGLEISQHEAGVCLQIRKIHLWVRLFDGFYVLPKSQVILVSSKGIRSVIVESRSPRVPSCTAGAADVKPNFGTVRVHPAVAFEEGVT